MSISELHRARKSRAQTRKMSDITVGMSRPSRISGTPKKPVLIKNLSSLLDLVAANDFEEVAAQCAERRRLLRLRVRTVRRNCIAVAVQIFYRVCENTDVRAILDDAFYKRFRRRIKTNKLLRDILLFVYGEEGIAGTDATALSDAVQRSIPAEQIPAYIEKRGGLENLLKAERERRRADNKTEAQTETPITLHVKASSRSGQQLKNGPAYGTWALIVPRPTRNGAGTSLAVTETKRQTPRLKNSSDSERANAPTRVSEQHDEEEA